MTEGRISSGKVTSTLAAVALAATAVLTPMAANADRISGPLGDIPGTTPPPAGEMTIDVVTANGTGCKPGTTTVAISPDKKAMTMTFSEYVAEAGPGIAPDKFRRNCQLALNLHVPNGFSAGVVQVDYRGFAKIAKGAEGQQRAAYYYQGSPNTVRSWTPLKGAYENDYTFTDKPEIASVVWSPCGEQKLFNVNTELRIQKGTSTEYSMMTTDSVDASVKTTFSLIWKKCEK